MKEMSRVKENPISCLLQNKKMNILINNKVIKKSKLNNLNMRDPKI